jgi:hypothetical protein
MSKALIALFVLTRCSPELGFTPPVDIAGPLRSAVRNHQSVIELSRFTDFDWDQVVFLGPYTPRSIAEKATGSTWPDYEAWDLERSDTFSLVVFIKDGVRVRVSRIKRCEPEFPDEICGRPFSRRALFRVSDPNGCPTFVVTAVRPNSID